MKRAISQPGRHIWAVMPVKTDIRQTVNVVDPRLPAGWQVCTGVTKGQKMTGMLHSEIGSSQGGFMSRHALPLLAAVIAVVTFVVYLPALGNGFVTWDDDVNVYENLRIRSLDATFLRWAFTDITISYWQPLIWISHALDYAVWGLNPFGHHLTNNLIHAVNAFLVVLLAGRLVGTASAGDHRQSVLITAGAAGILFGIHPMHVESVAWVTERKDLVYSTFFLLSVMSYLNYADTAPAGRRLTDRRYLLSFVFFLLASASKPMAVTLPAVLLLLDLCPLGRLRSLRGSIPALLEKVPFACVSIAVSVTAFSHKKMEAVISLGQAPLAGRLMEAARAFSTYLWKMAVPVDLSPYYPDPKEIGIASQDHAVALFFLVVLAAACACLWKRHRMVTAAMGYYLVTLLPVSGIIKTGSVAISDRFTYLPSLGPFLLAGLSAAWIWKKAGAGPQGRLVRAAVAVTALSVGVTMTYITVRYISLWKDGVSFWSHVIENYPLQASVAYGNRGNAFRDKGLLELAITDYDTAIGLEPSSAVSYLNRGLVYQERGQDDKAIQDYTTAISLDPASPVAYNNRGLVYKQRGDMEHAMLDFNKAIGLAPGFVNAYISRGWTYEETGRPDLAMEEYHKAIALDRARPIAYNNRGMLHQKAGRPDLAIDDFTAAVARDPGFAQAYTNRGLAYEQVGQLDAALQDYSSAIRVKPSFASAYNNRGYVHERKGRLQEALADFNQAIRLQPGFAEAYNNRGLVHEGMGRLEDAVADYSRAIELRPDNYTAYGNRGIAFGKMNRTADSLRDHRKACLGGIAASCEAAGGGR